MPGPPSSGEMPSSRNCAFMVLLYRPDCLHGAGNGERGFAISPDGGAKRKTQMNLEIAEKLQRLGLYPSKDGNSESNSRSRVFRVGNVKAVLCVRDFEGAYQYRILLANAGRAREQEQWFTAKEILNAVFCLIAAGAKYRQVKRAIEERFVCRSWRKIISRLPAFPSTEETGNGYRD